MAPGGNNMNQPPHMMPGGPGMNMPPGGMPPLPNLPHISSLADPAVGHPVSDAPDNK